MLETTIQTMLTDETNGVSSKPRKEVLENLIRLAQKEQQNGNSAITTEKIDRLHQYLEKQNSLLSKQHQHTSRNTKFPKFGQLPPAPLPKPKHSPLFRKFKVEPATRDDIIIGKPAPVNALEDLVRNFTIKKLENFIITVLETIANMIDNLHLFSKMPMFPEVLKKLLKNTNRLWVLILVFLIRKTVTQLLNVIRKQRKVRLEMKILNSQKTVNEDINKKYKKVLKDLKFDRMMLYFELVGNFMDLGFNVIELYGIPFPDWFMNTLNFSSMLMTVYRMNKDDEYLDDDITEDLI